MDISLLGLKVERHYRVGRKEHYFLVTEETLEGEVFRASLEDAEGTVYADSSGDSRSEHHKKIFDVIMQMSRGISDGIED
jgi:hypothetical protein